jgi:hypothetical protein
MNEGNNDDREGGRMAMWRMRSGGGRSGAARSAASFQNFLVTSMLSHQ